MMWVVRPDKDWDGRTKMGTNPDTYTVRNKLKHPFFEVMPRQWRVFQVVAIETFV